jgi:exopolysaccharide biosynthesis polyprenyl glycosylphosphotransferase
MGHRPVGYVDIEGESRADTGDVPVVGSLADLADAVHTTNADIVILASTALAPGRLPELCASLHALGVEINISAGLPHIAASRVTVKPLDGLAMLSVRANQLSNQQKTLKRAIDIFGSVFGLIIGAPLLVFVGLCVRLTSAGPAIFRQVRVGEGGKEFVIFKFRTMVGDAEKRRIDLAHLNAADGPLFKMLHDPRVTRVGRVLRHLGLDELPQLYNVFKGEMSLVGPRPPLPTETERYDEWARGRLRVKPGITGLWQVNGRHELSFADYVRYDLFYVENWSVIMDIFTMVRTIPVVFTRRGAA